MASSCAPHEGHIHPHLCHLSYATLHCVTLRCVTLCCCVPVPVSKPVSVWNTLWAEKPMASLVKESRQRTEDSGCRAGMRSVWAGEQEPAGGKGHHHKNPSSSSSHSSSLCWSVNSTTQHSSTHHHTASHTTTQHSTAQHSTHLNTAPHKENINPFPALTSIFLVLLINHSAAPAENPIYSVKALCFTQHLQSLQFIWKN